jgi:hypothetical protein
MPETVYLDVTEKAGRAFFMRGVSGPVTMLNLLRFRAPADYSATPHLAPLEPIDGATAYQRYMDPTRIAAVRNTYRARWVDL